MDLVLVVQVAEVMARLDQQHAEVEASREHRGIMLEAARKLDAACEDVAWLTAFEQDEDRYKVQQALPMPTACPALLLLSM